jgi:hypothetical protein
MTEADPDPPVPLVAAVLAAGVWFGLVEREDVIAWADHLIEKTDQPPLWMIDLSLSHDLHVVDVVRLLNEVGTGVVPIDICRGLYGFLPSPEGYSFEQAEALAKRLYQIARHCFDADWRQQLLCDADQLDDTFLLVRDATFSVTTNEVVWQVWEFLDVNRNAAVKRFIAGLTKHGPTNNAI